MRRRRGSGEADRTCMIYNTSRTYLYPQNSSRRTEESSTWPWRPWWRGHGGAWHNTDYSAVESKTDRTSRSGAHHEHDGVLDEGGDVLERPGHGEVGRGGAPAGHREERVAPVDSGQPE